MKDREGEGRKRRLEGMIPELIKRAVEAGVEKAAEAPDTIKHFVGDMKLPKEIAHYILSQVDETKNGLFRVVAKEMRDFLEHTNIAGELQKVLTTVQFEINTTIRFRPNDGKQPALRAEGGEELARAAGAGGKLSKPEVKTRVHVTRERPRRRARGGGSSGGSGGAGGEGGPSDEGGGGSEGGESGT
jgi:hypothetical protein